MSRLKYTNYEGFGEWAKEHSYYSQAVRVGDIIETSGQGGWNRQTREISSDITEEIEQAFDNVDHNLKVAGAPGGWKNVYNVRIYHDRLGADEIATMIRLRKQWCPDHAPLWTLIGIDRLGLKGMRVEIEVTAHVPPSN